MIASFSCNFVFIRTRKTASTSTEIVLGSWCNVGDVITSIGVDDEFIRFDYGGTPSNFCSDVGLERDYKDALANRDKNAIQKLYTLVLQNLKFHHHMSASEVGLLLPQEFYSSAFKFCFDRHPYEKVLSLIYWRKRKEISNGASAQDYIDPFIDGAEYRNYDLYSANGKLVVDRVFRYEDLWEELASLAWWWGKELPKYPPRAKGKFRKDRRPASEVLSVSQIRRIVDVCWEEFDLLGYKK